MANRVEIDTELNADGVVRSVDEIEKEIDKVIKAQERLQAKFDKFREMNPNDNSSKTFRSMQYDAAQLEIRLEELNAELERANSNNMQISLDGLSESAKRTGGLLTNLGSKLKSFVKTMGTNLVQSVKKGTRALLDFLNPLKKTNNSLKSGITTLLKYGFGIRSLFVLVNKLRSALVEGMKNLAQFNDGINPTNTALSNLKSSLTQLKNSFASAFAPILTVIEPIITKMINLLSKAATAVGMFFAALTGQKTFIKATAVQENYAKSLEKTSKAAKKAKTYLSGLDEVRQYTPAEEDESGNGADAGVGNMFEEVPIDSKFQEMANKFKDFLKQIKELIEQEDWKGLGQLLGSKVNEAVDAIPWNGIGHKIGYALNAAIQTAYWFLKTIDFHEIGKSFAELFNGIFAEIDFEYVGRLAVRVVTAFFDAIIGFFGNLDYKQIAKAIEDTLNGAFDEAQEWLKEYDWAQMGKESYKELEEAFKSVDTDSLSKSFWRTVGMAIGAGVSYILSFLKKPWEDMLAYFYSFAYDENDDGKLAGKEIWNGVLQGIYEGVMGIGQWLYDNVFTPFIEGFRECFQIASPSKVMEDESMWIMEGIYLGLSKLVDHVLDPIRDVKKGFIKTFEELWGGLKGVINTIISGIETMANGVVSGINTIINALNGIKFTIPEWLKDVPLAGKFAGKSFGFNISTIGSVSLPRLATGTVVPRQASEFIALMGDNNKETEVVSPLSTIEKAVENVLSKNGSFGNKTIYLTGLIDRRVLFEEIIEEGREQSVYYGRNPFDILANNGGA